MIPQIRGSRTGRTYAPWETILTVVVFVDSEALTDQRGAPEHEDG